MIVRIVYILPFVWILNLHAYNNFQESNEVKFKEEKVVEYIWSLPEVKSYDAYLNKIGRRASIITRKKMITSGYKLVIMVGLDMKCIITFMFINTMIVY